MKQLITSLQHPLVKHLVKLRINSDYRYEHRSLVLEGSKPIREVLKHASKLIYAESFQPFPDTHAEQWVVSENVLQKISGLSSPEGVIAEVQMPAEGKLDACRNLLVFDGISDPGNMGTLLRTALAFGWDGVFILPNSCDIYNEKVLRAARGAHFKLPMAKGTAEDLLSLIKKQGLQPLLAELHGQPPEKILFSEKRVLIMGNEAHGASKEVQQFCLPVTIPMSEQMESLNVAVAGGILLYLLKDEKRRL